MSRASIRLRQGYGGQPSPAIVSEGWTLRARQAVLVLVLLACSSSLESSPPAFALSRFGEAGSAQANSLTVLFSPSAGTFVGSETVTLRVQARASIHYTLDGSLPTVMSPIYRGPVTLDKSTRLRAVAIVPDAGRQGPVATEIYLRVDPDTQNFTSHLPIILIHTFESGTLDSFGTEHVPAALQVLEPKSGTSRIVGRAALDARIGIHVRGQTSRNFPKKQYAMELRADDEDADSDRPMLGLPSHSDWVLSDPVFYDRALIRNALAFALSNRIGRYAPRTRFAEVFMVDDGGDVRAGSFLGFFTLIEKIERDPQRVNVSRLPASAASLPAMTGGFILRIDKGVPDFDAAGRWLQFVYPDPEDMSAPGAEAAARLHPHLHRRLRAGRERRGLQASLHRPALLGVHRRRCLDRSQHHQRADQERRRAALQRVLSQGARRPSGGGSGVGFRSQPGHPVRPARH